MFSRVWLRDATGVGQGFVQLCGLLLLTILPLGEAAANPACPRPIEVAYYDFGVLYQPDTASGVDPDLIHELARRTGCVFQERYLSRVLIWKLLETGELDMTLSGVPTPERERFAVFAPYLRSNNQLLSSTSLGVRTPLQFLQNPTLRLGVVRGYRYGEGWDDWIESLRQQGRIEEAPEMGKLVELLLARRIAAFPAHPFVAMPMLKRDSRLQGYTQYAWFAQSKPVHGGLVFSKQRLPPETIAYLSQTLEGMRREGLVRRIFARYMTDAEAAQFQLGN